MFSLLSSLQFFMRPSSGLQTHTYYNKFEMYWRNTAVGISRRCNCFVFNFLGFTTTVIYSKLLMSHVIDGRAYAFEYASVLNVQVGLTLKSGLVQLFLLHFENNLLFSAHWVELLSQDTCGNCLEE